MGKSFRNKNKNKQQRAAEGENGVAKPDEKKKDNKLMNYVKVVAKENAEFEKYYKFQNLCDDEAEHAVFMEHCRMALPTGLRVNGVMVLCGVEHTRVVLRRPFGSALGRGISRRFPA